MRGRKPKPAKLRVIEGNKEHRPIYIEPKPTSERPTCPKLLDGEARKAFRLICRQLGAMDLLSKADTFVIIALATSVGTLADARKAFTDGGSKLTTFMGKTGTEVQNPLLGIMNRSIDKIGKLSAQLALDPTARARLGVEKAKPKSRRERLLG